MRRPRRFQAPHRGLRQCPRRTHQVTRRRRQVHCMAIGSRGIPSFLGPTWSAADMKEMLRHLGGAIYGPALGSPATFEMSTPREATTGRRFCSTRMNNGTGGHPITPMPSASPGRRLLKPGPRTSFQFRGASYASRAAARRCHRSTPFSTPCRRRRPCCAWSLALFVPSLLARSRSATPSRRRIPDNGSLQVSVATPTW